MLRKFILLALLFGCATAQAATFYIGPTGQTLYIRIQTGPSSFVATALTEGSTSLLNHYSSADATVAALTGMSSAGDYAFQVRVGGTPSTTAADTIVGFGTLYWTGSTERPASANTTHVAGTAQTARDIGQALPNAAPDAAGGLSTNLQGPRVYYVQSTGSDSNSGLVRTSPLLNPPTSAARNGDTVHFIGSNSFAACSFTNRRVKITGDRASNTTLTITGGGGLIVASGSEVCDIKIVNGLAATSSCCIDLANTDFVNVHDVILDAGSGDKCLNLDNSSGIRLSRSKLTSAASSGIEGYAVNVVENNAGTGGATSIEIDNCYISGGRAAVYLEDRSVAEIRNSRLICTYGRADANSAAALLLDEHYNQGPQFRLVNTRLETTTSGSHTGIAAGITHWTNTSGAGSTSQFTGEMVGGSITVTGAAGATVRHLDANLSGSSLHWSKVNHDTTKDNGSYVVKDDGLLDWGNGLNKTATNALTNTTIGTVSSIASGGITSSSFASNSITAAAVATDAATEIGAAAGGSTGGPIEQRAVPNARILEVKSRTDGSFGVTGKIRMKSGESHQLWALEYKGTQLPVGGVLYGMSAPTAQGAEAANLTIDDYGVDHTQAKLELSLSSDAATSDTISVMVTVQINATETVIVSVPVVVGG